MDKNMHDRLEASQKRLKEIDELLQYGFHSKEEIAFA